MIKSSLRESIVKKREKGVLLLKFFFLNKGVRRRRGDGKTCKRR